MVDVVYTEETLRLAETRTDCRVITWTDILANTVGTAVEWPFGADKSVQVTGTPAAAHCFLQGSNDGVNFYNLTDPQGLAIDFTAAGLKAVTEIARYVRPAVTGGDGTTILTVTLLMRRARTY